MNKLLQPVLLLLVTTCFCSIVFAREEINTLADERKSLSFASKEPLFVSLGSDCKIADCLAQIGYRRASFPFDWLLTLDHKGIIKLLDDNFKFFLYPGHYSIHNGVLIHSYYHIEFRHEHDNDLIGKYERRIDRFRRLNNYSGKVFFMRESYEEAETPSLYWPSKDLFNISFKHALELKQVLEKRFPNLDFTLVIVNFCCDINTIKITDDIIIVNADMMEVNSDFLSKLVKVLLKYTEDPLFFVEEFFLDDF